MCLLEHCLFLTEKNLYKYLNFFGVVPITVVTMVYGNRNKTDMKSITKFTLLVFAIFAAIFSGYVWASYSVEYQASDKSVLPGNVWDFKVKPSQLKIWEKWHCVWATREGLVGEKTATGHIIKSDDLFVALPSRSVLKSYVEVCYEGKRVVCQVLDVGPHSIKDEYWNYGEYPTSEQYNKYLKCSGIAGLESVYPERGVCAYRRPVSEIGKRVPESWGTASNKAGIDLSDGLWKKLGIPKGKGIVVVFWKFTNRKGN